MQAASSPKGFTLIEILVVLFIISIVTSVALLSISRNENQQLKSFTNELTQLLTLAEERAMLQPSVLGLALNEHSLQFKRYLQAADGKQPPQWLALQDRLLGEHAIPKGVVLKVEIAGQTAESDENVTTPQIIISTNGELTPFTIYIGKLGEKPRYIVRGDVDGEISNNVA